MAKINKSQFLKLPRFSVHVPVWKYEGAAAWHFVTLPKNISVQIKKNFGAMARGWGSIPVLAKLGQTQWESSLFFDGKREAYLFPLKASVRKKENVLAEQRIEIEFEILIKKL